jgi:hypothetical protein
MKRAFSAMISGYRKIVGDETAENILEKIRNICC